MLAFTAEPAVTAGLAVVALVPADKNQLDENAVCLVATADPTRTLSGSVKGIGSAPIPFA